MRLILFDVDGTLVDSQAEIVLAMHIAFGKVGLQLPARSDIVGIIGLSLNEAVGLLGPDATLQQQDQIVAAYKEAFAQNRTKQTGAAPLFKGATEVLIELSKQDHTLLGIATGKSRRGLDALLQEHGLNGLFHTEQVADHHPSKPNPSMILTAMNETGAEPDRTIMIGDTRFDMEMARAAGVRSIGVDWGYHPTESLRADMIANDFAAIPSAIDDVLGEEE